MAIVKNPKRNIKPKAEREAQAFIANAGTNQITDELRKQNKEPIMIRIDPDLLRRIDHAAKRLGISRSAFIVSSAARQVESME
ncbi:MAG: ribbon-helix-helix protein, CopG family [Deltaproteobacteria bacterium]|nr:ribbon-helix-helix protein, CopG family [Deltaproteobacteria bacterium]